GRRTVAGLLDVARPRRRTTDRARGRQPVGGTAAARSRAGLGDIAAPGRAATHLAGRTKLTEGGAARTRAAVCRSEVTCFGRVHPAVTAGQRGRTRNASERAHDGRAGRA